MAAMLPLPSRCYITAEPIAPYFQLIKIVSPMPPNQILSRLWAEVVQGKNVFPSIICEECDCYPTHHRCLVEVSDGGFLFDGLVMCCIAVCAICSTGFGNEGSFKCAEHAPTVYERPSTEAHDSPNNRKESNPSNRVMEKENCPPNN
jgi:hypothetical protein